MNKKDVLILVKTYPEYSDKYTETVCTAGILAENKQLIRLYPLRYRYLEGDNRFSKYQWINAVLTKAASDPRPESYNIHEDSIRLGKIIDAGTDWHEREQWVLNENTLYNSLEELYDAQKSRDVSLGIVILKELNKFYIESKLESDIKQALLKKEKIMNQLDMFKEKKELEILPFRFILHFQCESFGCNGHNMSILDWEFGQLYRNVKKTEGWKDKIENKVYEICNQRKDTYLIVGNMARRQHIFCILGFFYPPKNRQIRMFG